MSLSVSTISTHDELVYFVDEVRYRSKMWRHLANPEVFPKPVKRFIKEKTAVIGFKRNDALRESSKYYQFSISVKVELQRFEEQLARERIFVNAECRKSGSDLRILVLKDISINDFKEIKFKSSCFIETKLCRLPAEITDIFTGDGNTFCLSVNVR